MTLEVSVLAGGLSARFGGDKARLRFGRRTMLSIVRATAGQLGVPVRVIRRDAVARCGPLGGVWTALSSTHAGAVLFLACDMPLVTAVLLRRVMRASRAGSRAVFAEQHGRVGFPFLLPRAALDAVRAQIEAGSFSLHGLARALDARTVHVAKASAVLLNVNTADEARAAARFLRGS